MSKTVSRGKPGTVFGIERDRLDEELDELVYTLRDLHGLARDIDRQGSPRERRANAALHFAEELRSAVRQLEPDGTVRGSLAAVTRQANAASSPRPRRREVL